MDKEEIEGIKEKICRLLKEYDPDIVEVAQFGSSVYAPEYARDVDLLVITKKRLPQPYKEEFDDFINILHVDYFYNGNYPANYEEAFEKWHRKVEEFVSKLEEKRGR